MSTNSQAEYERWLGQQVLAQSIAQQEEQEQLSKAANQNVRNQQIASDRARAAQDRTIEAAQAQQRQRDKEREKELVQAQQARAEQVEASTKEVARQEWLATDGHVSDFEKQWPEQYRRIQAQRAEERDAQAKAKFVARYGGF